MEPASVAVAMSEVTNPSREAIAAEQLEQLRSLVTELFPANKFYSAKLNAVGITFDIASLEDFSARFPFTTKSELVQDQLAHPPFGTNLTYPLERYTRFHQTSGTTGTPLRCLTHRKVGTSWWKAGRKFCGRRGRRLEIAFILLFHLDPSSVFG